MALHQFDYIFAIGILFAFLDAWNIGANDVANSFATSVSSRSLTLRQAMMIASVCEFLGALLVGARVSDTIRSKILDVRIYQNEPTVLMLGMACALVSSSLYLTVATKFGMPVSTTHSIIGGVIGIGVASIGWGGVNWGWKGVSQVFAAWAIAPGIAGIFAAIIFLITKFGVMRRKNPVRAAFYMVPVYFGFTSAILTMLIVWKGAPTLNADKLSTGQILGAIFGVGAGVTLLCIVFFLPYLYRILIKEDWQLKPWHILLGPLLLRRGDPPPKPVDTQIIQDYYSGHKTKAELEAAGLTPEQVDDVEKKASIANSGDTSQDIHHDEKPQTTPTNGQTDAKPGPKKGALAKTAKEDLIKGPWYKPLNLFRLAKYYFFYGVNVDVVGEQSKQRSILTGDLDAMHARATHYDNKAEHMYSFLQVLTAATSSFSHGANDVSNAVGPLSTIYLIWSTAALSNKAPVPIWVLAFGGGAIVIGLWTYGYNVMRNLGNRLTLHSPSRGFSMELGSATTVVMATQLALPISTTQCITGATVGVGLCTGDIRSINWRMILFIYAGWIITVPCTAIVSGCLMGIIINAPQWGSAL